jgi:DNA-binding transcriptional MerR regulator
MTNKYDWLNKKTSRSVDNIYLWAENPRLNLDSEYNSIRDFAEELIRENKEKDGIISLAKSIANYGFVPADPIVIWQNSKNNRYYVAEGNRRVLVLKMLRNPSLAPKAIRTMIQKLSNQTDKDSIKKVPVSVAPSFEDAEWYISQRHSTSTLQRRWETEQQLKWVMSLYDKYGANIQTIQSKIDLSEAELKRLIRIFKLKNFIISSRNSFTKDEYELVSSMRFPITTFERFFSNSSVKERWGLEFEDYDFKISSDQKMFLNACIELVKRMILDKDDPKKLDSRALGTSTLIEKVLDELPSVSKDSEDNNNPNQEKYTNNDEGGSDNNEGENENDKPIPEPPKPKPKDDPNRERLIHSSYHIHTDKFRIEDLFNELKYIPFKWKNSIAASIRIFIDLAVLNYIIKENLQNDIEEKYRKSLREITLSQRLEFLKNKPLNSKAKNVLTKFLNNSNDYSLDVLNGYQHNNDTHYIQKNFLNNFWNFLFPLVQELVEITEEE